MRWDRSERENEFEVPRVCSKQIGNFEKVKCIGTDLFHRS